VKTALLFGATGLVGHYLVSKLNSDPRYSAVKLFLRRPMHIKSIKLEKHLVNFDHPESFSHLVKGDDLFCCLGTTIRKAGSKEKFRAVDYDLVLKIAKMASENGVKNFVVVSSVGANPNSRNFYLRTKGEMERDLLALPFTSLKIIRPSILTGNRKEFRLGERIGIGMVKLVRIFLVGGLKKYKPIHGKTVAKAMLTIANRETSKVIFESAELKELGL